MHPHLCPHSHALPEANFASHGYYFYRLGTLRVIVLNTIFYTKKSTYDPSVPDPEVALTLRPQWAAMVTLPVCTGPVCVAGTDAARGETRAAHGLHHRPHPAGLRLLLYRGPWRDTHMGPQPP